VKQVRQDVELLRLLSALGIVWFHTQVAGAEVGYGGLIFFLIATIYFGGRAKSFKQRALRLLVPWSIWMVFYGAINLAAGRPLVSYADGFVAKLLWGTANHLWYLPFAFLALVLFDRLRHSFGRSFNNSKLAMLCGIVAAVQLGTAALWREPSFSLGFPWATFVHAIPALLLGVFIWGFNAIHGPIRFVILTAAVVASGATVYLPDQGLPYLVGLIAASVLLLPPTKVLQGVDFSTYSKLSLGIYLIHPFLLDVCMKFELHFGMAHPLAIFFGSATLVWLMQKLLPRVAKYVV
jgi:hypothetical protein